MTSDDDKYEGWVRDDVIVDARYAQGGGVHARGRVVAYWNRPTVMIITDDGERKSWIADLCEPAELTDGERAWADLERLMAYNVGSPGDQDAIREYVRIIEDAARKAG